MIEINLIKNQVPESVDIPKKLLKKRKFTRLSALLLAIVVSLSIAFYFLKSIKNRVTTEKTVSPKVRITKESKTPNIKEQKIANKNTEEKKERHVKLKKNKQKIGTSNTNNQKQVEKIEKAIENEPIFTIALQFESIPKKKTVENVSVQLPPLPEAFLAKQKKNKKVKKKKTSPFYLVKLKTTNPKRVSKILKNMGIKYSKKRIKTKEYSLYDVYVGGFYSYPQLIMFSKALKLKGYKIYSFKNINLLYYVCIDTGVNEEKMIAYKKAWSKTKFKILFLKRSIPKYVTVFTFTTANRNIINSLKKRGFYPIIRRVKNGA